MKKSFEFRREINRKLDNWDDSNGVLKIDGKAANIYDVKEIIIHFLKLYEDEVMKEFGSLDERK